MLEGWRRRVLKGGWPSSALVKESEKLFGEIETVGHASSKNGERAISRVQKPKKIGQQLLLEVKNDRGGRSVHVEERGMGKDYIMRIRQRQIHAKNERGTLCHAARLRGRGW